MTALLQQGDCRQLLAELEPGCAAAVVTDPPYEIGINGQAWDSTGVSFDIETWQACRRIIRPGGYLLAFGATRTHHRMTCAIEDAGFTIQDEIGWWYAQGQQRHAGLLKPAHEPVVVARNGETSQLRTDDGLIALDRRARPDGRRPSNVAVDDSAAALLEQREPGASSFFFVAKPSSVERKLGSLGLSHDTVKPVNLMRWLVRMVSDPGDLVVDPFLGSGTTCAAALIEGRRFAGMELLPDHLDLARRRIADLIYPWGRSLTDLEEDTRAEDG